MYLQQELDKSYHSDTLLRDRLLTAVDIPVIQSGLRNRVPRSIQQAKNLVAIQLREHKRSVGSASDYVTNEGEHDEARYSLDRSYSVDAPRSMKRPYKVGGRTLGYRQRSRPDNARGRNY